MKLKNAGVTAALIVTLIALTQTVMAVIPGNTIYQTTRQIANNLQYVNTISWDSTDGRGESFVLRYTAGGSVYPIALKDETIYGPITISDAVAYAESLNKNVIAAFNSDFFAPQTGVPFGIVIEDGVYKSSPEGRNAVSFDANGGVKLHRDVEVSIRLENQGGANGSNGGKTVNLTHFNKYRTDTGGLYMFSEHFSTVSTRTVTHGWFVRFRVIEGTPKVSGTMRMEVVEKLEAEGEIEIGEGYIILTAATAGGYGSEYEKFAIGDVVTLTTESNDVGILNARYATGAGDPLVTAGVGADTSGWDALMQKRSPRTAIGIKEDGTVICYTIDGRDYTQSVGLIPEELVNEMLRLGCVEALNLDGGGSTALSIKMPGSESVTLINKPSDGRERKCGTYIFFITDAESDGKAQTLALSNDGAVVLSGSSIELEYAASDSGYVKVEPPQDIEIVPSLNTSTVVGNVYTAGEIAGTDQMYLHSSTTDASGTGNIVVITEPTSLTITAPNSTEKLTKVTLKPGQELEIALTATYYRRSVTSQNGSYTYEITGDVATMMEPGIFKAAYTAAGKGRIIVSAGGTKAEVEIEIKGFDDMLDHWAQEYVSKLAGSGIVKGITETEYGPELEIKRGDFVLMLHRAAGSPETASKDGFYDVEEDSYYANAIVWAREQGIAAGVGAGLFEPQSPLTREQAFTFVYRSLDILGVAYESGKMAELERFADRETVSEYAQIPSSTLVKLQVVEGSDGMLSPTERFTRAQMGKVLCVVLELPKSGSEEIVGLDVGYGGLTEISVEPPGDELYPEDDGNGSGDDLESENDDSESDDDLESENKDSEFDDGLESGNDDSEFDDGLESENDDSEFGDGLESENDDSGSDDDLESENNTEKEMEI